MAIAPSNHLGYDARSLDGLKGIAARDPKAAVREAAKQFESLFMQQLLKSMRSTTMNTGMLDSEGGKLGTEMLDTQLSGQLSGMKGGLSDAIMRQLERQMGLSPGPIPVAMARSSANTTPQPLDRRCECRPGRTQCARRPALRRARQAARHRIIGIQYCS